MKHNYKLFLLPVLFAVLVLACNKVADLPHYGKGTSVQLTASTSSVVLAEADSTKGVVNFSWTSPEYSIDSSVVKYLLEIDTAGRQFAMAATFQVNGHLTTTLTGRDLNAVLLNFGYAPAKSHKLEVRVVSSYQNNNERYVSNTQELVVTPYGDPAKLSVSQSTISPTLANASQPGVEFSWAPAFAGYTGQVIYTIQYDSATKNFANLHELDPDTNVIKKALTQGEINETALNVKVAGGTAGKVEYRLKAMTMQGAITYSNTVAVTINSYLPILRFYLPGSYQSAAGYGNDWTPETAPELVRDLRPDALNRLYYTYIYLPAGAEFKVTQGRSWDVNYGGTGGDLASGSPNNLKVTTAGYYRVSVDRVNLKYDIREGRMGFVGGGTGAGWTPPNVFPAYAMGAAATNLFVGLTDLTVDGWKMIDGDSWNDGSNTVGETRSYGSAAGPGGPLEINGPSNFAAVTTAGRYRTIWDGRNVDNVVYQMSPATEMRVVGNGIDEAGVGEWSPGTSPQMTYTGNGIWTITIKLKADKDIKFLAGNDWGAFDYEDASGGSQAVGTAKKIRWDGSDNFKTPATGGTYTITLNENTQTVTIGL